MKFSVGDLVWITSAFEEGVWHDPPALIIAVYEDIPRIFPYNEAENKLWVKRDGIGIGTVYDIFHERNVEIAVMGEWLRPFTDKR